MQLSKSRLQRFLHHIFKGAEDDLFIIKPLVPIIQILNCALLKLNIVFYVDKKCLFFLIPNSTIIAYDQHVIF
ncbi:Uncharacterized protein XB16_2004 [Leptospira santarosai]|uniref:Uncharacterized protein n=1 Tax=Leptospira santarosai TaxID=28183 RepID=A0A2P1QTV7_9LEPT|nr:Uncharacterized protein XB16_2004 [Leptospira santarosai]